MRITHPKSGIVIDGTLLGPGEVLKETDLYDSTTGKWERADYSWVGVTLPNQYGAVWVRPDEPTNKRSP